jgi:hypothetical protein
MKTADMVFPFIAAGLLAGCGAGSPSPTQEPAAPLSSQTGAAALAAAAESSPPRETAPAEAEVSPVVAELIAYCSLLGPEREPDPPCPLQACTVVPERDPNWRPPIDREPLEPPAALPLTAPASATFSGLSKEVFRRIFLAQRDELACCLAGATNDSRVVLGIVLGGGRVAPEVSVQRSMASSDVGSCLAGVVRTWSFPRICDPCAGEAARGEAAVMITYPVALDIVE